MNSFADRTRARILAALIAVVVLSGTLAAQTPEDLARRRLESGRAFLKSQNYIEAMKDFEAVLQTYPTSAVADDALLEIATYQLEVVKDAAAADARVKELLKTYAGSDSAPMALVLEGRVAVARGLGTEQVNAALASFDRVARLFPGSEAVPMSMYYAGETARLGGRREQAIQRFGQLATQFPTSPWTARALIGAALSQTRAGQSGRAMEQLQRVRNQFPGSREAALALDLNTVLYRLYLRAPAQPAFVFSGRTVPAAPGKLKDVAGLAIDADNNLLVASNTGVVTYNAKGTGVPTGAAAAPKAVTFDRLGKFMTIHETGVRLEGKTAVPLQPPPGANGVAKPLKLDAAVMTTSGDLLVADREQKSVMRFSPDGKFVGELAKAPIRRLAIDELDNVAALDADAKTVTLFGRDGKVAKVIPERGTGYQLRNPTDVAFDRFGHLYVLDRVAVLVFTPDGGKLLTTFSVPDKAAGSFGNADAFALDSAGRLFVFDGRSDSVKVYR